MDENTKRFLVYGSIAAGALLILTGRRPAGIVLAAAGAAALAADHPEKFEELWRNAPQWLERGNKWVDDLTGFLERVGQQGARIQEMNTGSGSSARPV